MPRLAAHVFRNITLYHKLALTQQLKSVDCVIVGKSTGDYFCSGVAK